MAHIDRFYEVLGLPIHEFRLKIDREFINILTKWRFQGGASRSQRKTAIQEAVDALKVYEIFAYPDFSAKKSAFQGAFKKHYPKESVPDVSPDIFLIAQKMKLIEATHNILFAKFSLLDYWLGVVNSLVEPDHSGDFANWATHEFLNFDPKKVRPILELMVQDA